jgi:hypothetical protein
MGSPEIIVDQGTIYPLPLPAREGEGEGGEGHGGECGGGVDVGELELEEAFERADAEGGEAVAELVEGDE